MIAVSHSEAGGHQEARSGRRQDVLLGLIRRQIFRICIMDICYAEGVKGCGSGQVCRGITCVPVALCSYGEQCCSHSLGCLSFLLCVKLAVELDDSGS